LRNPGYVRSYITIDKRDAIDGSSNANYNQPTKSHFVGPYELMAVVVNGDDEKACDSGFSLSAFLC